MKCPFCAHEDSKVIDSRPNEDRTAIRRRRECQFCKERYTTYERLMLEQLMVIKRDLSRQPFDREKLIKSVMKSCVKRPVSTREVEKIVDGLERREDIQFRQEITTKEVGEWVLSKLKALDTVAYIRFASVYQSFEDVQSFLDILKSINKEKE